ncbi:hypothetical protein EJB05_56443 [Eragrostis curvula]|uniref:Uncharacterized protein n=1 Tax=Eragrostis curvula TaxID=38414 RepID=A0A5J9SIP1_9POAL|nr:hypothetical protein EJB05_56443 [Eragrostis curvula]
MRGFLPFWDALAAGSSFVASLYNSTAIRHAPSCHAGQFVDDLSNKETEAKAMELDVEGIDPHDWQLWSIDYLFYTTSHHAHAGDPMHPRVRDASAPSSRRRSQPKQRKHTSWTRRSKSPVQSSRDGSFLVTYAAVVATLQLFLHLARADVIALLLPMLSWVTTGRRA